MSKTSFLYSLLVLRLFIKMFEHLSCYASFSAESKALVLVFRRDDFITPSIESRIRHVKLLYIIISLLESTTDSPL